MHKETLRRFVAPFVHDAPLYATILSITLYRLYLQGGMLQLFVHTFLPSRSRSIFSVEILASFSSPRVPLNLVSLELI